MITREENELLTRIGSGTPCGSLMRRYWQPVALTEELAPGGPPRPVRHLGEDLVLFRDDRGRPGLLGLHCSHRGTDLSYGRIEDGGLRCAPTTAGFTTSAAGSGAARRSPAAARIGARSAIWPIPCREAGGVVFAYLGAGSRRSTELRIPDRAGRVPHGHEGFPPLQLSSRPTKATSTGHLSFLHRSLRTPTSRGGASCSAAKRATTHCSAGHRADDRSRVDRFRRPDLHHAAASAGKCYLRITNLLFPNAAAFGGSTIGEGYSVHWHVPIDDGSHWKYIFMFSRERPLTDELRRWSRIELTPNTRSRATPGTGTGRTATR
jgi:phenylpropionate dioxygenase-like ring-hydroxylating dioxygenase large terminal subunit